MPTPSSETHAAIPTALQTILLPSSNLPISDLLIFPTPPKKDPPTLDTLAEIFSTSTSVINVAHTTLLLTQPLPERGNLELLN